MTEPIDIDALEARATWRQIDSPVVLALIAELRQERERAERIRDGLIASQADLARAREAITRIENATRTDLQSSLRITAIEIIINQYKQNGADAPTDAATEVTLELEVEGGAPSGVAPTDDEREGRRWYAACWRDDNGTLNRLDSSTVSREYAEADVKRWRAAEAKQEDGQPELVVLATKISHPWMPVEGEAG